MDRMVLATTRGTSYLARMPTPASLREEAIACRELGTRARGMAENLDQKAVKSDLIDQALELEERAQELERRAAALETADD